MAFFHDAVRRAQVAHGRRADLLLEEGDVGDDVGPRHAEPEEGAKLRPEEGHLLRGQRLVVAPAPRDGQHRELLAELPLVHGEAAVGVLAVAHPAVHEGNGLALDLAKPLLELVREKVEAMLRPCNTVVIHVHRRHRDQSAVRVLVVLEP